MITYYIFFDQILGLNSKSMGKSSSLPISISNERTIFEKLPKNPKFCEGPTIESPGPMLLIVAATEVNTVVVSWFSIEIRRTEQIKTSK